MGPAAVPTATEIGTTLREVPTQTTGLTTTRTRMAATTTQTITEVLVSHNGFQRLSLHPAAFCTTNNPFFSLGLFFLKTTAARLDVDTTPLRRESNVMT